MFAALNSGGLDAYADFVCEYAPEVADQDNMLIYAPNNKAVDAYLAGNPQASANAKFIRDFIVRRSVPDPNANAAAKGNTGLASNSNNNFGSLPPRGSTGGGGSSGAKVSRPATAAAGGGRKRQSSPLPPGYVGTLTAGGGGLAVVLKDSVPYGSNNYYFEIDSFTTASQTCQFTIGTDPRLMHFGIILARVPVLQELLFTSKNHTVFIPTEESLKACSLDPTTASVEVLERFVKDHIIVNSNNFIGYTPEFKDGGSFQVYSGQYVSSAWDGPSGTQTVLNHKSMIVQDSDNIVTDSGTIQVIDKPLFSYYTPY